MDKKISIVNTRDNEFEFDISIEGVKTEEMAVSFVIETKEVNLQFPCKKEGEKWVVVVPPMPLLELASYPFCVTIVVDGYFFKPFEGTAMVIHEPTVKAGAAKKMAPPVVTMTSKEDDDEKSEDEEETKEEKPVKKTRRKTAPKKKTATRRKTKVEPKKEVKEEVVAVEEPITPPVEEPPVVEEPVVEEPKEDPIVEEPRNDNGFGGMADALLKKHRIPRTGLAPTSKKDEAAQNILDALEEEKKKKAAEKLAESIPEKKTGKKDDAVQAILMGSLKKD